MTEHGATESLEIERKYEVPPNAVLPGAEEFTAAGFVASAPETVHLVASYYDTPERGLARVRLAVRSRSGGADAGWHLKERGADGVRELWWPAAEEMPEGLRDEIDRRAGIDAADVVPVASLRTARTIVRLSAADDAGGAGSAVDSDSGSGSGSESSAGGAHGGALVEIADDTVRASDGISGVERAWREWEAELFPGAERSVLDAVEPILLRAGAEVSLSTAKIARATGQLVGHALGSGANASVLGSLALTDLADRLTAQQDDQRAAELRLLARRVLLV